MHNTVRAIGRQAVAASIALMFGLVGIAEAQQQKIFSSPKYIPPVGASSRVQASSAPLAAPLSETFKLHSRPSATKILYLDFDGHVTTGTGWNTANAAWPTDTPTITSAVWSIEGNDSFSNNELTFIQEVWMRVSECYSPFDVDVTTEPPLVADLINTGDPDTKWGTRICIGATTPSSPGGGWAFGSFGPNSVSGNDTPCFVFNLNPAKVTADTCVHEAGHTFGLGHDGLTTPVTTYYGGHGTGPTGWAPHMGAAYSQNLAQFSKGEYLNANNFQDDLATITRAQNGVNYRLDDAADTQGGAAPIAGTTAAGILNINQSGVIERTTDTDWYKITCGAGNLTLNAVGGPANTMLDIQIDLFNSTGTPLASSNPVDLLTASISRSVSAGTYYVKIDGVGRTGDGSGSPPDQGYSDYSSLGQYTITGTCVSSTAGGNVVVSYNKNTLALTLTGDTNSNSVTVTQNTSLNRIEVVGTNGTKINNKTVTQANPLTYPFTGPVNFGAVMGDGNDSVYLIGVYATQVYLNLGNGSDNAGLQMCTVTGKLNVDGGTGTGANQKLVTTTSSIPPVGPNRIIKNIIHIP